MNLSGIDSKGPSKRQTFKKDDRLLKRSEFLRLAKAGERIQNRLFIAYFSPNTLQRCRLGITITRKVGKAATRNRIKRLAREQFRKERHRITGYWDINLIAKNQAADMPNGTIANSVEEILARIGS